MAMTYLGYYQPTLLEIETVGGQDIYLISLFTFVCLT